MDAALGGSRPGNRDPHITVVCAVLDLPWFLAGNRARDAYSRVLAGCTGRTRSQVRLAPSRAAFSSIRCTWKTPSFK